METALDQYVIRGVKNNIPLLRDIIQQPKFIEGDISTNFLAETYPDGFPGQTLLICLRLAAAHWADCCRFCADGGSAPPAHVGCRLCLHGPPVG